MTEEKMMGEARGGKPQAADEMENERVTRMGSGNIPALVVEFAVPAILGMLVNGAYNIIDSVFLGHGAGEIGLSAVSVATPIMTVFMAISMLIGAGGNALCALQNMDIDVAPGEAVAILGPSGCGKSTSLLIAAGLRVPTQGAAFVDGVRVAGPRLNTALILQDFGLLPWKTVAENAGLGLQIRKTPKRERAERVARALEQVGLADFADAFPAELSGGMRQRLAMARALTCDADLLLMDEPLSALDALLREEMQDMLKRCWREQGYAQVLVTHSIEEAVYLGQRIVVMSPRPGRVVHVLENAEMQQENWRDADLFFERCRALREMLRDIVAKEEVAHA